MHTHIPIPMAALKLHEPAGKMSQLRRKIVRVNARWRIVERVSVFRRFFRFIWDKILVCSTGTPHNNPRYRKLFTKKIPLSHPSDPSKESRNWAANTTPSSSGYESDSDLVSLKISVLGDSQIGKTSFLLKYVGDENEKGSLQLKGLNIMDKIMGVDGARIAFRIWDVGGDSVSSDQVPIACKDAVAILFMFDLTSRCTLNSVIGWYNKARKWNQRAIPVVKGTKFDDFVQLPPEIQWSIVIQALAYAKAMKATLFFSSATHNINVNKIFKYIMANLFNLPWTLHRNLTIGEPIIDF